jgi:hypothetical protein
MDLSGSGMEPWPGNTEPPNLLGYCNFSGSHSGVVEDSGLLGCDAVSLRECKLEFSATWV